MGNEFERALALEPALIALRRRLHEIPELAGRETETVAAVCGELDALGAAYTLVENGGILGKIPGGRPGGRSILLRADLDGLPLTETPDNLLPGGRACVSRHGGRMHACGHDAHAAMLLGAIRLLLETRETLAGDVWFAFERGEEGGGNFKYLFRYMELHSIRPDTCFAIHVYNALDSGVFGIPDGPVMAGGLGFDVTLTGRGGHGSRPDQAVNPIDCFAALYPGLQSLRLRSVSPFATLTGSVGLLQAGEVGNVIPETLRFAGSMRLFDVERVGKPFRDAFVRLVEHTCQAYGCTPRIQLVGPFPGTENYAPAARFAREVLSGALGARRVCVPEPWLASESFGGYLRQWPGVLALLGIRNPSKGVGAAHHNPAFDVDEDVLKLGAAAEAAYAAAYLERGPDAADSGISLRELLRLTGDTAALAEFYGD